VSNRLMKQDTLSYFRQEKKNFLTSNFSRATVRPTQCSIQWLSRGLSQG